MGLQAMSQTQINQYICCIVGMSVLGWVLARQTNLNQSEGKQGDWLGGRLLVARCSLLGSMLVAWFFGKFRVKYSGIYVSIGGTILCSIRPS
jgi:hypothetical protein